MSADILHREFHVSDLGIKIMERKQFKTALPQLKRGLPQNISDFEYLLEMPLGENVEFEKTEISNVQLKENIRLLNVSAKSPFHLTVRERFDGKGWVVIRTDQKQKPRPNAGRKKK